MDRLTPQKRKAIGLGFVGLLLIVLGAKFMFAEAPQPRAPLVFAGEPALLFFNLNESCECMREMVESANKQITAWPEEARAGIQIHWIDFEERPDLASQYEVFRVPCLVLLDAQGEIVYRQDYPLANGGPLNIQKFNELIKDLREQE